MVVVVLPLKCLLDDEKTFLLESEENEIDLNGNFDPWQTKTSKNFFHLGCLAVLSKLQQP